MLDALNITAEEALGLAELAQHDLALARDFARRAQAAVDTDEANTLARSYQRAARSYRQTLALKARLRRELATAEAHQASARVDAPCAPRDGAARGHRVADLREALQRLAWNEAERPEDERVDDATDAFDAEAFIDRCDAAEGAIQRGRWAEDFADEPLDDHVARLGSDLGFAPDAVAGWRNLPDPPEWAFEIEPDRQSSA